jgi:hypothetical protein
VMGHVMYGDTQRPARLATVMLFGVPEHVTAAPRPLAPGASEAEQLKAMTAALGSIGKTNMTQVQTGMEGAFTATDVPPGDYYVFGAAAGYVSPLNQVEAITASGADMKLPLPGVPIVHVSADRETAIDVTLQRGASISGTISWDDGSPLAGAIFAVVPSKGEEKPPLQFRMLAMASLFSSLSISDDLGHYRVTGLGPGKYILKAVVQAGAQSGLGKGMNLAKAMAVTPLTVYAPATLHKTDARPIELQAGEAVRDEAVTLDLSKAHTVSGQVESAEDHHGINDAKVQITDVNDQDFTRSAAVDASGNFKVTFVPAGTYKIVVNGAEDTVPDDSKKKKSGLFNMGSDKTVRSYQNGTQALIVTDSDVSDVKIALAVDKTAKSKDDGSAALGALLGGDDDSSK